MTTSPPPIDPHHQATFRLAHDQGCAIIIATGEIDLRTAPELRTNLRTAAGTSQHLIIDLEDVSFIDSTGLAALVHATQLGCESVTLVGPSAMVRKLLQLTQLDRLLPIYETQQDAVNHH